MKNMIKEDFNITEQGPQQKHLGVEYIRKHEKFEEYWEVQLNKFRTEMLLEYEMLTGKKIKSCVTPGAPGKTLGANNGETIMEAEYHKIVGKLLWSTKKDSLDWCANAVCELSLYFLSCPGKEQHWDGVSRVFGFLSSKLDRVLKIREPKELRVIAYVDSDWVTNSEGKPEKYYGFPGYH
jgi:hypothetical protein